MFSSVCMVVAFVGMMCIGSLGVCAVKACNRPKYKSWFRAFKDEVNQF